MDYSFDLQRIFFGDLPPVFLLEIAFRTVILFSWLILNLRFIGQRGVGQLTLVEFIIIIALGSAAGDPLFYEDVPVTHGMTVITLIVVLQRILNFITNHNHKVQDLVDGVPHRLVYDGLVDLDGMKSALLSRDELFMELRQSGIEQLGQVRRAYLEIDGHFSLFQFEADEIRPGLPLMPSTDTEHEGYIRDASERPVDADYACSNCGQIEHLSPSKAAGECPRCGELRWVRAGMNLKPGSIHLPPSVEDSGE